MKNKLVVGLLLICSALCLSSCGNTHLKIKSEDSNTRTESQKSKKGTAEAKEEAYSVGSSLLKISGSIPKSDITFVDSWKYEGYCIEAYNLGTNDKSGQPDGNFLIAVVQADNSEWKFLRMSSRYKALHEYTAEELSAFNDECENKLRNASMSRESEVVTDKSTNQGKDIDYEWYIGRFYRDISNTKHWIDFRNTEKGLTVDVPGYSFIVSQPEVIESKEYGTALRYQYKEEYGRFDFILDYMIERDEVVVLFINYTVQSANAVDYSGVYVYDDQLSFGMGNAQTSNDTVAVSLVDGQNFECFETVGGEDIMLKVHLYYSDDSDTPPVYKGEMNNGVWFWFELYDTHTDEVRYKINCFDNSNAFLTYYPSRGEIELTAEEGTEYGNMYSYCGTYICLPDEFEE